MRARDIMTKDPQCCRREETARRAAEVMRDYDCGVIPVIDDSRRVVGIITDRDLAIRAIAAGKTADTRLSELMTPMASTCFADDDLRDVERKMVELQVRRIPIVDAGGRCLARYRKPAKGSRPYGAYGGRYSERQRTDHHARQ